MMLRVVKSVFQTQYRCYFRQIMKRRWPQDCGRLVFIVIIIIVLTQLHLITSAPTSTVVALAGDVAHHVTSSWQRQAVPSSRKRVPGNVAADSGVSNARFGRQLRSASQGCGPVCNRCRQVTHTVNIAQKQTK